MDGLRSGTSASSAPAHTRYFHAAPADPRSGVTPTDTTEPKEVLERKRNHKSELCENRARPTCVALLFPPPLPDFFPPLSPYTQQLIGALTPPESHRLNSRIATAVLRAVQRAENGCAQLRSRTHASVSASTGRSAVTSHLNALSHHKQRSKARRLFFSLFDHRQKKKSCVSQPYYL